MEDVSTRLWILKARESEERLNYYQFFSIALSVEDVSAIIILVLLFWVLKSRESEGRLKYYYTFSNALGTQVKRK